MHLTCTLHVVVLETYILAIRIVNLAVYELSDKRLHISKQRLTFHLLRPVEAVLRQRRCGLIQCLMQSHFKTHTGRRSHDQAARRRIHTIYRHNPAQSGQHGALLRRR